MKTEDKKPSNPNAFPTRTEHESPTDTEVSGMTLRDYFANSVMQSLLSQPNIGDILKRQFGEIKMHETDDIIANTSYRVADAMLKQREL